MERQHFLDLIRGVEMDLTQRRYASFDRLHEYILRDVSEDAQRGRVYLPLEDLDRFDCTEEEREGMGSMPRKHGCLETFPPAGMRSDGRFSISPVPS